MQIPHQQFRVQVVAQGFISGRMQSSSRTARTLKNDRAAPPRRQAAFRKRSIRSKAPHHQDPRLNPFDFPQLVAAFYLRVSALLMSAYGDLVVTISTGPSARTRFPLLDHRTCLCTSRVVINSEYV